MSAQSAIAGEFPLEAGTNPLGASSGRKPWNQGVKETAASTFTLVSTLMPVAVALRTM